MVDIIATPQMGTVNTDVRQAGLIAGVIHSATSHIVMLVQTISMSALNVTMGFTLKVNRHACHVRQIVR